MVLPAISALHGLVLASSHANGAVDLDIYGAFQFCAIGILAAPLTVRISRTYFYDPGRNIIFLWTILILMGLVALCVEFYRVTPTPCASDIHGNPLPSDMGKFPYGNVTCGITCSEQDGPFSPMRGGSASNINIIPVPQMLTFNAAMLLAAGFCIPAILSLIFTWDKILEINWSRRRQTEQPDESEIVEGANITVRELKGINNVVRKFLSVIEIPLFGGVIVTLIGIGEANFYSPQARYDTEPMASIGQWSPISGTLLAALGSLYLLWYSDGKNDFTEKPSPRYDNPSPLRRSHSSERQISPSRQPNTDNTAGRYIGENALGIRSPSPNEIGLIPTITHPESEIDHREHVSQKSRGLPTAGRQRIRRWFTAAGDSWANAAHQKLDVSDYNDAKAHRFPEVPGEILRNPDLERTSRQYSQLREERASSTYAASIISTPGLDSVATPPPILESPRLETSPIQQPKRRDTLEVPAPTHTHRRNESK